MFIIKIKFKNFGENIREKNYGGFNYSVNRGPDVCQYCKTGIYYDLSGRINSTL